MKILVLGGQGFIGQNLCQRLLSEGHDIRVLEYNVNPARCLEGVLYKQGNFTNIDTYKDMLKDIDVVYHLISTTNANNSNREIKRDIEENVIGTVNLLDACVEAGIKKVVFASSGGTIYGIPKEVPIPETHPNNPICSYGITKLAVEKYLNLYHHLYGLDYVSLRLSNPYGPLHQSMTQGLINVILQKVIKGEPIEVWGDGKVERDYIYIDDVIDVLDMVKDRSVEEKVFNVGSGQSHSICDIINEVESAIGEKVPVIYKEARSQDVPVNVLDIKRIKTYFGWKPKVSLSRGIHLTYRDLIANNLHGEKEVNGFEKIQK